MDMSFKAGMEMKITGKTKPGCEAFSINIGHDADTVALHFNPRFNSNVVVCNSNQGGSYKFIVNSEGINFEINCFYNESFTVLKQQIQ
uniref:Galectin n=1 Tax=Sinocyclocheilus grahami TaxID=75366 RepID=A0A672REF5_SINGR